MNLEGNMEFKDIFRSLMDERGISQKNLAQELHLAPSTVGNYANAYREPDFETLIKIADYFSVSTDYLIGHQTNKRLAHDEEHLIQLFRQANTENQQLLLQIAALMAQNNAKK